MVPATPGLRRMPRPIPPWACGASDGGALGSCAHPRDENASKIMKMLALYIVSTPSLIQTPAKRGRGKNSVKEGKDL